MSALAPSLLLAPFVRTFTVIETPQETTRTVIPDGGIVLGFRYGGRATELNGETPSPLPNAAIVGMRDTARRMRTSAGGGIVLAMFRDAGAAAFFAEPLHELFGRTVALEDLVPRAAIDRVGSRLANASDHAERVAIVEQFLLERHRRLRPDPIVAAAVRSIRATRGRSRIALLAADLGISHDRLEKRFRHVVGASPKQLASIVRLRHAIDSYRPGTSLTGLSVDAGYFDQSHFIRELRAVTGAAPQQFFRAGDYC